MAIDLKKSFASVVLEKPIATGVAISTEGQLLMRVVEDGVEKVQPTDGSGTEVVVGFSMANNEQPATAPVIQTVTAPVIAPAATGTVQLAHTNLVGTSPTVEVRVFDNTSGAAIATQVATALLVTDNTKFHVNKATGVLTVYGGHSQHSLTVSYRYNLTVVESQQLYFQPNVNNTAINVLGLVGVYSGKGQIFTLQYDASKDYSGAAPALTSSASGFVTIGGAGVALTNMRVIKAPTASDLSLGLEFLL